ncbi:hypothetical protein DFH11DRAFT_1641453 [Phellopilus nigrolimitatus]|nr:hypothetical protein DFH11DRAFT_1641453 [Phellopilus nigrolimitatus]
MLPKSKTQIHVHMLNNEASLWTARRKQGCTWSYFYHLSILVAHLLVLPRLAVTHPRCARQRHGAFDMAIGDSLTPYAYSCPAVLYNLTFYGSPVSLFHSY